jgi:histidine kinase/DNA gyrase B/HSP90-like ATPase
MISGAGLVGASGLAFLDTPQKLHGIDVMSYRETRLWQVTLGQTGSADIERLRVAFTNLRAKSELICSSITADLAHFTVHDITHLDALWEMGSALCGETVTINPLEAFVLGGAFLLHDAGLTVAAYPGGVSEIVATPEWREALSSVMRQRHKGPPLEEDFESPGHETMSEALKVFLRVQHARRAERLTRHAYSDPVSRAPIYLIEDGELRDTLGLAIGEIAASHWWDLSEVARRFGQGGDLGVPAQLQGGAHWTVDRLKLACLLRGADAIHLDARRAPALAHAIRFPHGEANAHWEFQKHVLKPYVRDRRVVFTSTHRFSASEAQAWWQGYELLANADRELEGIESLLVDLKKDYRLAASGVLGAKDPSRLAAYVPTQDWFPVDATIHVSNVGSLVKSIGGYELYGEHYYIPLRELLQNASDAIRARRYLSAVHTPVRDAYTGRAVIIVDREKESTKLIVRDNGVGMSLQTLSKELLDFGNSLWASDRLAAEFPKLLGTGFAATGRYGIGFFSSFMWASRVQVTTRKFSEGERTYVLEFLAGAARRPLVREPRDDERLTGGGTEVTLWIDDPFVRELLEDGEKVTELCRWLCPAIDFDLLIANDDGEKLIVGASDVRAGAKIPQ